MMVVEPVSRLPLSHTAAVSRSSVFSLSTGLPPLAPRDRYVKLHLNGDPSTDMKLQWLYTVTKNFHLQLELAEVKMEAVAFRFVYISKQHSDIFDRLKTGEFSGVSLLLQGLSEGPKNTCSISLPAILSMLTRVLPHAILECTQPIASFRMVLSLPTLLWCGSSQPASACYLI